MSNNFSKHPSKIDLVTEAYFNKSSYYFFLTVDTLTIILLNYLLVTSTFYKIFFFVATSTPLVVTDFIMTLLAYHFFPKSQEVFFAKQTSSSLVFLVISGILNAIYKVRFELIMLPLVIELFYKLLVSFFFWSYWKTNAIATIFNIILLSCLTFLIHNKVETKLTSFLVTHLVLSVVLIVNNFYSGVNNEKKHQLVVNNFMERNYFAKIITNLGVGLIVVKNKQVEVVNNQAKLILKTQHVTFEDILKLFFEISLYPELEANEAFNEIKTSWETDKLEEFLKGLDGSLKIGKLLRDEVTLEVEATYLKSKSSFSLLIVDLTKSLETENVKTEMKLKQLFLAKIAHEVKNPILSIMDSLENILELTDHLHFCNLTEIKHSMKFNATLSRSTSSFLVHLLYDFNTYASISNRYVSDQTNDNAKEANLFDTVEYVCGLTQAKIHLSHKSEAIRLDKVLINLPRKITFDEINLKQVLLNLLLNSVKFTSRGVITLIIKSTTNETRTRVQFTIKDTGIGMTEEQLKEALVGYREIPEYTREGSCFGWKIIRQILRKYGSELIIKSVKDVGTEASFAFIYENKDDVSFSENMLSFGSEKSNDESFGKDKGNDKNIDVAKLRKLFEKYPSNIKNHFTINIQGQRKISIEKPDSLFKNKTITNSTPRFYAETLNITDYQSDVKIILICDDDTFIVNSSVKLIEKYKKQTGAKVATAIAVDGINCLNLVNQFHSAKRQIDLLLIDETMPLLNGSEVIVVLRKLFKESKITPFRICSVTAYYDEQTIEQIKQKGADLVFNKPLNYETLTNLMGLEKS